MESKIFREMIWAGIWGDILGSVYEFKDASEIPQNLTVEKILAEKENAFGFKPGVYTDDTILMLCGMSSFIEKKEFDPDNQMKWLGHYIQDGYFTPNQHCFDVGNATLASYLEYANGKKEDKYQRRGNGILMKMAPFSFWFLEGKDDLDTMVNLTHSSACVATAREMMNAQQRMMRGDEFIPNINLPHKSPTGYHSCSWAIANKVQDASLNRTIINAIELGGDTDTNACIWNYSQVEDIIEKFIETKNAYSKS